MVAKGVIPEIEENGSKEFDEGWWSSVLSDEEANVELIKSEEGRETQQSTFNVDWDAVETSYVQEEVLTLVVHGFNRGGVLVQADGIQGFVPVSHLVEMPVGITEEERRKLLSEYVGRQLSLKIIECEPAQERVVLSERAALSGEGARTQIFHTLEIGSVTTGAVTNITDFGVFIDLGGVEGLVHVSELSWGRVQHPSQLLSLGEKIEVMVLAVNQESGRIALSLKRMHANPWEILPNRYRPGDVVGAVISSTTKYGAFARLDEGIEGLIHISSIHLPGEKDVLNALKIGQKVQVRILHIDCERRRLGLGLALIE